MSDNETAALMAELRVLVTQVQAVSIRLRSVIAERRRMEFEIRENERLEELVGGALRALAADRLAHPPYSIVGRERLAQPFWSTVGAVFALGPDAARALAVEYDFDPHTGEQLDADSPDIGAELRPEAPNAD